MSKTLTFEYQVPGDDFTRAGEASSSVKNKLKMMGVDSTVIRKVSIAMYEGEINMVIHANGGTIKVLVSDDNIRIILADTGPGIPDVEKPCSRDTLPLRRKFVLLASAPEWDFPI